MRSMVGWEGEGSGVRGREYGTVPRANVVIRSRAWKELDKISRT